MDSALHETIEFGHLRRVAFPSLVLVVIGIFLRRLKPSSSIRRIPGPSSPSWLVGNLVEYHNNEVGRAALGWHKKHGKVVRFKGFCGTDHLLISDPKAIAHIFSAGPYVWERDTVIKPRFGVMFGRGILSVMGPHHQRLRRVLLPAFNTPQIAALMPTFVKCASELRQHWDSLCTAAGGPDATATLDIRTAVLFATLNCIGQSSFGYDFDGFNTGFDDPLLAAMAQVDEIATRRTYSQILLESCVDLLPASLLPIWFAMPARNGCELRRQLAIMEREAGQIYRAGLEAVLAGDDGRKDLLSVLVRANLTQQGKHRLTEREVRDQVLTFIFAGWTALLATLTEALRLLSTLPAVQSRLRAELAALPLPITPDALASARYLDAFWRELLRFSEPTQLERVAMQDDVIPLATPLVLPDGSALDAIPVRKGQLASFNVMQVNMDPARFGKSADTFDCERWLSPAGERLRQYKGLGPGAWDGLLNFGTGTRACPGARMAMLEVKTFLHTLLTSFEFGPGPSRFELSIRALGPTSVQ